MSTPARLAAASAVALLALPGTVSAAGPWTTSAPGGITWTAPHACSLVLDLATSDGYPARVGISQAHELVVAYRNGTEIGRTPDLVDLVARADTFTRLTTPVAPGDVVTVVHSSVAGLNDGTPNSVTVSASFTCPPPATTTAPPTTTTTTPPTSSVSVPPASLPASSTTTTTAVLATGTPPVPQEPPPSVPSPPVVTSPRPVPTTTPAPASLPETGASELVLAVWALVVTVLGVIARTFGRAR